MNMLDILILPRVKGSGLLARLPKPKAEVEIGEDHDRFEKFV
jgi:hypothetical protein